MVFVCRTLIMAVYKKIMLVFKKIFNTLCDNAVTGE